MPRQGRLPGKLLVISDRKLAATRLPQLAADLAAAGCPWLMIREKDLDLAALASLVCEVQQAVGDRPMALSVNSVAEVALETGLGGLHLSADRDAAQARALLGPDVLIGQSVHDLTELARADAGAVDYVLASPVFAPTSKTDMRPTLGLEGLCTLVGKSSIPVLALAGVTAKNAASCLSAGAAGVAVLGAVMASAEPADACRALLKATS